MSGTMASTLGTVQPFRYRGYVYDVETGLYYLRSRYYNPEWGRFINADSEIHIDNEPFTTNQLVYCRNNPICYADDGGNWFHLAIGAIVGAVIGVVSAVVSGGDAVDVMISGLAGAAGGVLAASGLGITAQIVGGAAISMASNATEQGYHIAKGDQIEFDAPDMIIDGAIGGVAGAISGNGASFGNTAGIKSAENRLLKNGIKGITKQSWKYFSSQAHAYGGKFVLSGLKEAMFINAKASGVIVIKNYGRRILDTVLEE